MDKENLLPPYNLITLLIKINNQYKKLSIRNYEKEFNHLLKHAIHLTKKKKKKIMILSIPDYEYTPFGKAKQSIVSREIDHFNNVNQEITSRLNIHYMNITNINHQTINNISLITSNDLHPSNKIYHL